MPASILRAIAVLLLLASPALAQTKLPSAPASGAASAAPANVAPTNIAPASIAPANVATAGDGETYKLGTGDKIRVIVYGEPDLGGEFVIDSGGYLRFPLVGQIKAGGLTAHQIEGEITAALKDGYVKDPHVNVEVESYRPFYIIGEVNKPGEYPYVAGLNAINAVALAGGYTYRADEDDVYIRRKGGSTEVELPASQATRVMPGDIVRIA
jgi:polysaccharide export outer membrane protein